MTKFLARVGHYAFLVALTIVCCGVMWWVSRKNQEVDVFAASAGIEPAPLAAQPRTLVKAMAIEPALHDVFIRYSGKIEPWEEYSLGFEIGGRVATLGENAAGAPLDDGDRVQAGQLLARLDDRVLRARLTEAEANLELAVSELDRSRGARNVISESEYQNTVTVQAQARAAQQVAIKSLEDSLLTSPVTGAIARRMVEAGESVNPNEVIFEVVENDRLRLVLNVPEARIRELELRRREVAGVRAAGGNRADPEEGIFRAHVRLEGADLYGNPWPMIDAEVYRIAETADRVTGLFEVEIAIDNTDSLLRPGMVATADLVTDRIRGYELPEAAVLFRQGSTYTYVVDDEPTELPVMFWDVGETTIQRARRVNLDRWIDQGETVLVPIDATELRRVVTRGQQRLRDGQLVRLIGPVGTAATPISQASGPDPSPPR